MVRGSGKHTDAVLLERKPRPPERTRSHTRTARRRRAPHPRVRESSGSYRARPGADSRAAPCGRAHRRPSSSIMPFRPSRLRSSTASRTARRARRGSPCSWCRCREVPRSTSGSPGPARPGTEPTRSPAASPPLAPPPRPRRRGRCLTASRGGRCPPRGPPTAPGHPRACSSRRERPHREEARPFLGRQFRHPDPVLAGEHAAVVRLHVADDGQAAAVPDAVQGAVEHRQPSLVREGLGTQETWGAGAVTGRCSSRPPLELL